MRKFKILIISLIILVSGCASDNKITNIELERRAPDIAMQQCQKIDEIQDGSFESIVMKIEDILEKYRICEAKRKALQDFIENK